MASASGVVGAVGALHDDAGRDAAGVLRRELILDGRRDEHVAVQLQGGARVVVHGGVREPRHAAGGVDVPPHGFRIEPGGARDRAGPVADADDPRAVGVAELRGPEADLAEALHDDPLAVEPRAEAERLHVVLLRAGFPEHVVQSAAGRLGAPRDAPLRHGLARDASQGIDLIAADGLVRVRDPGHLAGARAEVGRRHVDRGSDEVLADQLVRVAPRDAFDLLGRVARRVDLDGALGAPVRDVDDRALVGHQRRQRHDLVLVHLGAVADAALDREPVVAVLGAPGTDHRERPVALADREVEAVDAVAALDLVEQAGRLGAQGGRAIEVAGDVREESSCRHGQRQLSQVRRAAASHPQGAHGAPRRERRGAKGSPQVDAGGLGRSPIWRRPRTARLGGSGAGRRGPRKRDAGGLGRSPI